MAEGAIAWQVSPRKGSISSLVGLRWSSSTLPFFWRQSAEDLPEMLPQSARAFFCRTHETPSRVRWLTSAEFHRWATADCQTAAASPAEPGASLGRLVGREHLLSFRPIDAEFAFQTPSSRAHVLN